MGWASGAVLVLHLPDGCRRAELAARLVLMRQVGGSPRRMDHILLQDEDDHDPALTARDAVRTMAQATRVAQRVPTWQGQLLCDRRSRTYHAVIGELEVLVVKAFEEGAAAVKIEAGGRERDVERDQRNVTVHRQSHVLAVGRVVSDDNRVKDPQRRRIDAVTIAHHRKERICRPSRKPCLRPWKLTHVDDGEIRAVGVRDVRLHASVHCSSTFGHKSVNLVIAEHWLACGVDTRRTDKRLRVPYFMPCDLLISHAVSPEALVRECPKRLAAWFKDAKIPGPSVTLLCVQLRGAIDELAHQVWWRSGRHARQRCGAGEHERQHM